MDIRNIKKEILAFLNIYFKSKQARVVPFDFDCLLLFYEEFLTKCIKTVHLHKGKQNVSLLGQKYISIIFNKNKINSFLQAIP